MEKEIVALLMVISVCYSQYSQDPTVTIVVDNTTETLPNIISIIPGPNDINTTTAIIPTTSKATNPTTSAPNTTTAITPTTTSATTTPATNTTTTSSTPTTTIKPNTTTLTPTTPTTTKVIPTKSVTTPAPTVAPSPDKRKFDGPSFVGGIVLASGLMAIGFVAFKFYKARTELNYHTL